jgi:hypothetical protein
VSADVVIDHTDPIAAYGSAWLVDSHTTPSGPGGSLIVPLFVDLVAFRWPASTRGLGDG